MLVLASRGATRGDAVHPSADGFELGQVHLDDCHGGRVPLGIWIADARGRICAGDHLSPAGENRDVIIVGSGSEVETDAFRSGRSSCPAEGHHRPIVFSTVRRSEHNRRVDIAARELVPPSDALSSAATAVSSLPVQRR